MKTDKPFRLMCKIGVSALILLQTACSSIYLKSNRSEVELIKLPKARYETCSVSFIHMRVSELNSAMMELVPTIDSILFEPSQKALEESGLCGKISWRAQRFTRLPIKTRDFQRIDWLKAHVNNPLERGDADLNINFYFQIEKNVYYPVTALMGIVSFFSLGILPVWQSTEQQAWVTTQARHTDQYTVGSLKNSYSTWSSTLFTPFINQEQRIGGKLVADQDSMNGIVKSSVNAIIQYTPDKIQTTVVSD